MEIISHIQNKHMKLYIVTESIVDNNPQVNTFIYKDYMSARRHITPTKVQGKWVFNLDEGSFKKYPRQPKQTIDKLSDKITILTLPIVSFTMYNGRNTITISITNI